VNELVNAVWPEQYREPWRPQTVIEIAWEDVAFAQWFASHMEVLDEIYAIDASCCDPEVLLTFRRQAEQWAAREALVVS
jgi:hypothetical protein